MWLRPACTLGWQWLGDTGPIEIRIPLSIPMFVVEEAIRRYEAEMFEAAMTHYSHPTSHQVLLACPM